MKQHESSYPQLAWHAQQLELHLNFSELSLSLVQVFCEAQDENRRFFLDFCFKLHVFPRDEDIS